MDGLGYREGASEILTTEDSEYPEESQLVRTRALLAAEKTLTTEDTEYTGKSFAGVVVFHYLSTLHHKLYSLKSCDIFHGITIYCDDVGPCARLQCADFA